ncbi:MAG: c-type cytochrome [Chloroflexi bacterium]|nr:c-type cytochrome [Chloroflexota bacterium]
MTAPGGHLTRKGAPAESGRWAGRHVWPLALLLCCLGLSGCYVPWQPRPLIGEGPPPGYIGGDIPPAYRGLRNPYAPNDAQALAVGRALYSAYKPSCLDCHGARGNGLGPMAAYLEPKPADFGAPPMVNAFQNHEDYVFWWVSEGVPQTVMPDWQGRFDVQARWQVIAYARSLARQQSAGAVVYPGEGTVFGRPQAAEDQGR